nr:VanZ family protein [Actinomycetota bacterium]
MTQPTFVVPPRPPLPAQPPRQKPLWRRIWIWTGVYAVIVMLVAFWPQHVDKGAGPLLRAITHLIPILTYSRIEFGSNILFFLPVGALGALLLSGRRYLVVPIGFLLSLTIETVQGVFLAGRTASLSDLIANTAGACLGLLLVEGIDALNRSSGPPSAR